ncbi:hypothetical protein EFD32_1585 [Enterococcus faecalis D32]|nr:hypothetical protein EFD32_1585 [Enterococcus faecalis D32]
MVCRSLVFIMAGETGWRLMFVLILQIKNGDTYFTEN